MDMHKPTTMESGAKPITGPITAEDKVAEETDSLLATVHVLFIILTALLGLWGVACLVAGMLTPGGIVELITSWMSAVSAM